MDDEWDLHAFKVDRLCEKALTDLLDVMRRHPAMTRAQLAAVIKAINDQYGSVAAQDAADTITIERTKRGASNLPAPLPATVVSEEMADALAGWALAGDTPQEAILRAAMDMNRTLRNASRQTVYEATRAAGTRWARIPRLGACAFCLMLGSRGAVYERDTATMTKNGQRYHNSCHCEGREILDDSQIPAFVIQLQKQWQATRVAVGETWRDGTKHLSLDQWLDSIHDERMADKAARDMAARLKKLRTGVDVDSDRIWKHLSIGKTSKGQGGHLARNAADVLAKIKAGEPVVLLNLKTYFPDVPDDALRAWLGDETDGAIMRALLNPQRVIVMSPGRGYEILAEDTLPDGRHLRLSVLVNQAGKNSAKTLKVTSVYPTCGDDVIGITKDGNTVQLPMTRLDD